MKKNGATFIQFLMTGALVLVVFVLVVVFFGRQNLKAEPETPKTDIKAGQHYESIQGQEIRDFGNGVFKFYVVGDEFDETLSEFIGAHTNLELVGFSGEVVKVDNGLSTACYGATRSYTVVFREKTKP